MAKAIFSAVSVCPWGWGPCTWPRSPSPCTVRYRFNRFGHVWWVPVQRTPPPLFTMKYGLSESGRLEYNWNAFFLCAVLQCIACVRSQFHWTRTFSHFTAKFNADSLQANYTCGQSMRWRIHELRKPKGKGKPSWIVWKHFYTSKWNIQLHFTLTTLLFALTTLRFALTMLHFALTMLHFALTMLHFALTTLRFTLTMLCFALTTLRFALTTLHFALTMLCFTLTILYPKA